MSLRMGFGAGRLISPGASFKMLRTTTTHIYHGLNPESDFLG
jgi:hypothetical protein